MTDALRALSASVCDRVPEAGVHRGLPARAAALLLRLSGREDDEEKAASINPQFDRHYTYENDYLADPSRSFFALERRHADIALSDKRLNLPFRLQRTRELWLDPTFQPPSSFVDELRVACAGFKVETLDRQMGTTPEDHFFEELEPPLARCAPDLLADLVRRKLQSLASCPPESRYWSAIRATKHLILTGTDEASAAQALRLNAHDMDENHEAFAATSLLKIELPDLPDALRQFERLIDANLTFVPADFAAILHVPTADEVDVLLARYGAGSAKQQHDLILFLSIHPISFSDNVWSWLIGLARNPDYELRGVVFRMLARADATRFGRMLAVDGWSWEPKADLWTNHYGTGALISAEPALPFDQLAPRLAPWRLLEAARVRGADPVDVRLAAEIFGRVLAAENIEEPDPGANLCVDRTVKNFPPYVVSVQPRLSPEEQGNPSASASATLDADSRSKAYLRAIDTATSRIEEARNSGASLYLMDILSADMGPVLQHATDIVDRWLEGYLQRTADFRRRVCLAEPAFLALCEALLIRNSERGAELWRALRAVMATRYIGAADVDELLHIAFRVPDSKPITELREEVISLPHCHTDQALLDVAVAASYNGKAGWLSAVAEADQRSPLVWRKMRGTLLAGLSSGNTLPVADAWSEGEIQTSHDALRRMAAHLRWSEACAHHWWRTYLAAQQTVEAYAAWMLFLRSADRRAWTWMGSIEVPSTSINVGELKLIHCWLNRSEINRAPEKRRELRKDTFLGRSIVDGVGPWGKISVNT